MTITQFRTAAMLAGVLALTLTAQGQSTLRSADFAVTFTTERAKIATVDCGCFWLQGGSAEAAIPLFRGLAAVALVTGEHSANIVQGVDLSKLTFMAGPRYNLNTSRWTGRFLKSSHQATVFGEALFGTAHGFDSAFVTSSGSVSTANALSMQFGGGVNIPLAKGFGLRAIEADYVHTSFRNFASNTQNDLRLAAGVSYHFGGR